MFLLSQYITTAYYLKEFFNILKKRKELSALPKNFKY